MYENEIYSNSDSGRYTTYQTNSAVYGGNSNGNTPGEAGKKKKGIFRKFLLCMGLGLCFGLFAGAGFYGVKYGAGSLFPAGNQEALSGNPQQQAPSGNTATNVNYVTYVSDDVSDVVEKVMPAMVSIVNNYTSTMNIWGYSYSQPGTSAGSGIIVSENEKELLIVTNYHVVDGAEDLEILFIDGSTAHANIKGRDSDMDLAVIAVSLEELSQETRDAIAVATMGDSDSLKLGTPVIAIGNALGEGQSVTNGIISALDRQVTMEDGSTGTFIQTNAAINSGNSGGALLTITGEVIGINSGKVKGTGIEGMGYAIPISKASPIIADLMEHQTRTEKVAEEDIGYMGISPQDVTGQMAQTYGMPQGVYVYSVEENSAAEAAGMRKGDIIVKIDGQRISAYADLKTIMQYYSAGETVTIVVQRFEGGEYEPHDLEITFGRREK